MQSYIAVMVSVFTSAVEPNEKISSRMIKGYASTFIIIININIISKILKSNLTILAIDRLLVRVATNEERGFQD